MGSPHRRTRPSPEPLDSDLPGPTSSPSRRSASRRCSTASPATNRSTASFPPPTSIRAHSEADFGQPDPAEFSLKTCNQLHMCGRCHRVEPALIPPSDGTRARRTHRKRRRPLSSPPPGRRRRHTELPPSSDAPPPSEPEEPDVIAAVIEFENDLTADPSLPVTHRVIGRGFTPIIAPARHRRTAHLHRSPSRPPPTPKW